MSKNVSPTGTTGKTSRIDLYLQSERLKPYCNTDSENERVNAFVTLYAMAKSARDATEECNPANLEKWRKAYNGTLNALKADGTESNRRTRQLRKMCYELIESKVDNSIPMPKISPRYKTDLPLVETTENFLKFEMDRVLTWYDNDKSERSTYIDGTGWYKVWWDSLDNTHERSGDVRVMFRTTDQIIPQPGVSDYRQLEYIFERESVSTARIWDLYHRYVVPTDLSGNTVDMVTCYYLNDERIVGRFSWVEASNIVITDEEDWQIRKLRRCTTCKTVSAQSNTCPVCGGRSFRYENAETEYLEEDLYEAYNPYAAGDTDDESKDKYEAKVLLTAGTEIPYYRVRQLPFVPRPAISVPNSIYGASDVRITLDMQDSINKVMTKAVDKTLKSGAVVTKPEKMKIGDTDDTFKVFGVRTAEEAQMVQCRQIVADTSQDLLIANLLYDSGKASSGITNSFQGISDTTATSGKAKQFSAMQSAGRIESLKVTKSAAFAGVYELMLKYLLAFSDEPRTFVRILPDGSKTEETWNKYMFLNVDPRTGEVYYRDDFTFSSDPAATFSQNRLQMWQETQNKFVQGAFGNPSDPRVLKIFWNVMDSLQYPLARVALAGIEENEQHLPAEVEQAIMQNPELYAMVTATLTDGRGGARPNSGPDGNGATHAANVERTNERNRADKIDEAFSPQQT